MDDLITHFFLCTTFSDSWWFLFVPVMMMSAFNDAWFWYVLLILLYLHCCIGDIIPLFNIIFILAVFVLMICSLMFFFFWNLHILKVSIKWKSTSLIFLMHVIDLIVNDFQSFRMYVSMWKKISVITSVSLQLWLLKSFSTKESMSEYSCLFYQHWEVEVF